MKKQSTLKPHLDPKDWTVDIRVWVRWRGETVLGKGRVQLLTAIDEHHSISAAARELGMSYRRAWQLIQQTNEAAGRPLVTMETGGRRGGGATLTDYGREMLAAFYRLRDEIVATAEDGFRTMRPTCLRKDNT